ncbi:terpene synthase family protein [Streptomyces echinatus]|uniref:terpene synthase family protein n=1 Tax=Streptomyces echinatus TaxID=67293 RepID=UPI0038116702
MPQDTVFELPLAPDVSPDADGARRRSLDWCRGRGLVTHPVDQQRFLRWDIAGLMAAWLPRATGDRLDMAVDAVVVATFLDDQFDGPLADQPLRVAAACRAFTDVIASAGAVPAGAGPLTAAFAQVWLRLAHRASPAWLESAGQHWRWYVNAYVEEAGNRAHRHTPSRAEHFALRRRSGFVYAMLDLSQKAYGFELPPPLGRDPTVRRMLGITADVVDTLNDVHSVEKEESRGDTHNLALTDRVPPSDSTVVALLTDCMRSAMSGYLRWSRVCLRYSHLVPPGEPALVTDLLTSR